MASRIWRDATAPSSDIITFNLGTGTGAPHINQTNIQLISAVAVNEKPKAKLDELQDTGFASLTFTINGFIEDPSTPTHPLRVKGWMIDDKQTTSFPFGRFGMELDDFPHFNVRPTTTRGLFLVDWTWIRPAETRGKVEFIAILRFNATNAGLNSPSYNWA